VLGARLTAPENAPAQNALALSMPLAVETAPGILPFENALETALDIPLMDSIVKSQETDSSAIKPGDTLNGSDLGRRLGLTANPSQSIYNAKKKEGDKFSEWARNSETPLDPKQPDKPRKKKDPDGYGWEPDGKKYKCIA